MWTRWRAAPAAIGKIAFHRFQVTEYTQLSDGAQAIIDPSNAPEKDVVGVFSVRLRIDL